MKHLYKTNILIGSGQSWHSPLLSKHFLALDLLKLENNVTFVHTQRILKVIFPDKKTTAFTFHDLMPDALILRQLCLTPRLAQSGLLQSIAMTIVRKRLTSTYYPDIIISFDPVFYVLNEMYPNALKIYYCVDYLSENRLKARAENRLLSVCDLVIVASHRLFEHFRRKHSNVYHIPHGVNLLTDNHDESVKHNISQLFVQKEKKPVFGFLGNINHRVDFGLIRYIAVKNPQCMIALIGMQLPAILPELRRLPSNVFYPGPVPTAGIKYCLEHFDVGMVPYVSSQYNAMSHPIKILQYIAAGIPVVSTKVGEDFKENEFVEECTNYDEFEEKVWLAYKNNSDRLVNERIRFAKQHSWRSRLDVMDNIIDGVLRG